MPHVLPGADPIEGDIDRRTRRRAYRAWQWCCPRFSMWRVNSSGEELGLLRTNRHGL
jgi:hypothetical protein